MVKPGIEIQMGLTKEEVAAADPYFWYEQSRDVSAQRYFKMPQKYNWNDYEWKQV